MKKLNIFLSEYEQYLGSAKKIAKEYSEENTEIIYIEKYNLKSNEIQDNEVVFFLCNTPLINSVINSLNDKKCYIINKKYFLNELSKLEIQEKLIKNKISCPKIIPYEDLTKSDFPVMIKENMHAGITMLAYNTTSYDRFFSKFNKSEFYLEEYLKCNEEKKIYYINGILRTNKSDTNFFSSYYYNMIASILHLDVYSVDIMQCDENDFVIDVNPSPGFYLLDEARRILVDVIKEK